MITILKIVMSMFSNALPFILKHWRIVFIGLILCATFYYKTAYQRTVQEFQLYKADIAKVVAKKEYENEIIRKQSKITLDNNKQQYENDLKRYKLDRTKIAKELDNEKENITNLLNDAYRLRMQSSGSGICEVPTPSKTPTSRSDNNTIIALVESAKLCAIDYNSLMKAWKDNCVIYGCE